jgi:hypothetical protein
MTVSRQEYILRALNDPEQPAYLKKHWVISIFSIVYEEPDEWTKNPYPYRLQRRADGFYFLDPTLNGEWVRIDRDVSALSKPLVSPESTVTLQPGDLPNVSIKTPTTYGNLIFNAIALVYPFGNKIPFVTGKASVKKIEAHIAELLTDNVGVDELEDPDKIYVHEYLRFGKAMGQLQGLNYLFVPSASPKTLTTDPRIHELRAKLIAEHKDNLTDPTVVAGILSELQKVDRAWVDDDGRDFYIKDKSYDQVRSKTKLMVGYEQPFAEGEKGTTITNSLEEGWDFTKLPSMINTARTGSYNRGAETMLGGVKAKEAFRNFQNASISEDDCGTLLGVAEQINNNNFASLVGFSIVERGVSIYIDNPEKASAYVGKTIYRRSPMLCKTSHTDFCKTCMGSKLSENPNALGAIAAAVGSQFLLAFMKKMHVTNLKATRYNHLTAMS